jgi:hypothetical protein
MIHDAPKYLYCQSVCRTGFVRSRRAQTRIGPNLKNSSAGLGLSRSGEPCHPARSPSIKRSYESGAANKKGEAKHLLLLLESLVCSS